MTGIDRDTGKVITGWPHVVKSLTCLFTTAIGSRVMRRTFGSAVPAMLGRSISPALILRFKTAIIIACELWEPRYKVVIIDTVEVENTTDKLRRGNMALRIVGEYRPRGHLGDPTVEDTRTFAVGLGNSITIL